MEAVHCGSGQMRLAWRSGCRAEAASMKREEAVQRALRPIKGPQSPLLRGFPNIRMLLSSNLLFLLKKLREALRLCSGEEAGGGQRCEGLGMAAVLVVQVTLAHAAGARAMEVGQGTGVRSRSCAPREELRCGARAGHDGVAAAYDMAQSSGIRHGAEQLRWRCAFR
ncbi:hypothetical protein Taro_007038 [Colocasia esculenta]|uniref:Uncharacterized protein n=1 Tax=Colocasia esculenta TaxID=4460 RepID=A0A843TWZ9_COLES|nr:hypothetical protein [Colocasia esculenta]